MLQYLVILSALFQTSLAYEYPEKDLYLLTTNLVKRSNKGESLEEAVKGEKDLLEKLNTGDDILINNILSMDYMVINLEKDLKKYDTVLFHEKNKKKYKKVSNEKDLKNLGTRRAVVKNFLVDLQIN